MIRKKGRVNIHIDMTPMVDVIMLLLTFFMLTTNFKPDVVAEVILPLSHSAIKLPETDVVTVVVTKDNQLYMELDSQVLRAKIFGEENKLRLGIPVPDKNTLADLLIRARVANPKLRTVIRSDMSTPFGQIEDIITLLQKVKITRFSLVTMLEETT
ncbi:MAG TPA: biopolymer transporter ExbD [bacterium]